MAHPSSYTLSAPISHYTADETAHWHVQFELAEMNDYAFASSVLSKDSSSDQINWLYRLDGYADDGSIHAIPPSGVETSRANAVGEFSRAATAFYLFSPTDLVQITAGQSYWVRMRQSDDQGMTWGGWTAQLLHISGSGIKVNAQGQVETSNAAKPGDNMDLVPSAIDADTLTQDAKDAIATTVESHLLDEGDSQMLINAIVGAIGNTNIDQTVLVAAIRADLERSGGYLSTLITRLTADRAGYLNKLDVPGDLANTSNADLFKGSGDSGGGVGEITLPDSPKLIRYQ